MTTRSFRSFAKINLGLEVVGRRPDGYHELATLMVGRQVPLLFGLLLVAWTGWSAGASRAVRAMSWASWAVAVLLAAAVTVLWVDGPAARQVLLADQLSVFTVQWIRALLVGAAGIGSWTLMGWGLGRASSNTTP